MMPYLPPGCKASGRRLVGQSEVNILRLLRCFPPPVKWFAPALHKHVEDNRAGRLPRPSHFY